jgi:HEXXH motif-containing protein
MKRAASTESTGALDMRGSMSNSAGGVDWQPSAATVALSELYQRSLVRLAQRRLGNGGQFELDRATWSTPALAAYVHAQDPDTVLGEEARRSLATIAARQGAPMPIRWNGGAITERWVSLGLRALQADFETAGQTALLRPDVESAASLSVGAACESLLGDVWPEALVEARSLIRAVVFADGQSLLSGNTVPTFGAVYINARLRANVVSVTESLVHESGHHCLNVLIARGPLIENDGDMARSPLRPDLRPLSGILHACFVLARMAYALQKISCSRSDLQAVCAPRLTAWLPKLDDGLQTLRAVANLTERGTQLLSSLETATDLCGDL